MERDGGGEEQKGKDEGVKRRRGGYKSRWKEIKEKGSLSGLAQKREELMRCSITGQLIMCAV